MLRGMYGAAAGMIAQQQRQEMLTNNLANANTPGFKADQASLRSFPNMLIKAMNTQGQRGPAPTIGELTTGVYLQERMPNFRQGDLMETSFNTDVALLQSMMPETESGRPGALFYTMQNENGEIRYSRNGNLTVDGQGFLTSAVGHYVLDTAGQPVQVGNEEFRVNPQGVIFTQDGAQVAQLNVVYAEDPMQLVKEGDGLLRFEGEGELPTAIGNGAIAYQLQQGFLERSNVDAQATMTEMMNAYRSFEANQRVLQAYDQSLEKAVNEVGRIG
ncbi:flagellar basal-body rod protein FlgF [Halalkalibacter wakoensis JCM 9140]|uniref:Flagellar basal-body rod protein FlgF n=1 Tax=Halalkalibacter wakoensis JCM 9140 TaxID=1236970 RepID=W4QA17_9BACI|nr:flagellar hook-basal body protein [Halalkalibacter wakoensis]GAE28498.1 flagellar basal-body rod protein FlgF [Halalkalibacter wakoensis JCM 9140]